MHGALTLLEKLLTEFRGCSLEIELCEIMVCLSVDRGTCGPEAVRIWSKFWSEIKLDVCVMLGGGFFSDGGGV